MLVPAVFVALAARPGDAHADDAKKNEVELPGKQIPQPDTYYSYRGQRSYPSLAWWVTQFIPSPEVGGGKFTRTGLDGVPHSSTELAFGLRWQITPILWSWGTNRRVSRWRFFVAEPIARHSGSIELDGTLEYLWGHVDRTLARPGIRATFPLYGRGEYLSTSIGTSTYRYDGTMRVAYDAGFHFLYGIFGLQVTIAPAHDALSTIGTFQIRYF